MEKCREIYCWAPRATEMVAKLCTPAMGSAAHSSSKKTRVSEYCGNSPAGGEDQLPLQIRVSTARSQKDATSRAEWRPPLSSRENFSEHIGLKMCRWSGVKKKKKQTAGISSFPASTSCPALHWSAGAHSQMSAGIGMQWE